MQVIASQRMRRLWLAAALFTAAATPAWAAGPTYVVNGGASGQAGSPQVAGAAASTSPVDQVEETALDGEVTRSVRIVQRGVVAPAATVSRGLRQQPTYPDLIEVAIGVQTIYIDPDADLQCKPVGGLDENHTLVQAQRQADVPRPLPQVTIIHGSEATPGETASEPAPAAIIPVPERFRDPEPMKPKRLGPTEPAPRRQQPHLMARSSK